MQRIQRASGTDIALPTPAPRGSRHIKTDAASFQTCKRLRWSPCRAVQIGAQDLPPAILCDPRGDLRLIAGQWQEGRLRNKSSILHAPHAASRLHHQKRCRFDAGEFHHNRRMLLSCDRFARSMRKLRGTCRPERCLRKIKAALVCGRGAVSVAADIAGAEKYMRFAMAQRSNLGAARKTSTPTDCGRKEMVYKRLSAPPTLV